MDDSALINFIDGLFLQKFSYDFIVAEEDMIYIWAAQLHHPVGPYEAGYVVELIAVNPASMTMEFYLDGVLIDAFDFDYNLTIKGEQNSGP